MGRNYLAGTHGDAANAIIAAAGYNFRRLFEWLALLLSIILATLTPRPVRRDRSNRPDRLLHKRLLTFDEVEAPGWLRFEGNQRHAVFLRLKVRPATLRMSQPSFIARAQAFSTRTEISAAQLAVKQVDTIPSRHHRPSTSGPMRI